MAKNDAPLRPGTLALFAAVLFWFGAGPVTAGDPDSLQARGEREIVELHAFFQGWYRGKLEGDDFRRFSRVMDDDFVIILPGPRVLERQAILDAVRGQQGSDQAAELSIRNARLLRATGDSAVFTYEEWQSRRGAPARGVLSTVVFAFDESAPNGLIWLHVHESALPGHD